MDARDRLHQAAVACAQSAAVDLLRTADVRRAVLRNRYLIVRTQHARHARRPQQLVVQRSVDEAVNVAEFIETGLYAVMYAGDQLRLRFAEIGRDQWMCQRGAEPDRMCGLGQVAVRQDPQAL